MGGILSQIRRCFLILAWFSLPDCKRSRAFRYNQVMMGRVWTLLRTLWGIVVKLRQILHDLAEWWQKQEEATRELPFYLRQTV